MARIGGNPDLKGCGKKGRSGRKSANYEFAKRMAIEKAWAKVEKDIEKEETVKIALPIALKDMTVKTDLTTQGESLNIYAEHQIENIARRAIGLSENTESEGSN